MTGVLSAAPARGPIRLLIGSHLLLLVQTVLVFEASASLPLQLRIFLGVTGMLGTAALILAICGERQDKGKPWWEKRHAR